MSRKSQKITVKDIQLVQSLIERCLNLYMSKTEVEVALQQQAHINPAFTSLVWQKLEQQNPDFFKGYYLRLNLKDQITAFNYLVTQQLQLMNTVSSKPLSVPLPNNNFPQYQQLLSSLHSVNPSSQSYHNPQHNPSYPHGDPVLNTDGSMLPGTTTNTTTTTIRSSSDDSPFFSQKDDSDLDTSQYFDIPQ